MFSYNVVKLLDEATEGPEATENKVDVVVVGGGIAGLSAAETLVRGLTSFITYPNVTPVTDCI